jgi:hypothetical protein
VARLKHTYQCCFCGETINESAVDPCAIVLVGNWAAAAAEQAEQQFFCHVACFKKAMWPNVPVEIERLVTETQGQSREQGKKPTTLSYEPPKGREPFDRINFWACVCGALLMLFALANTFVTLASGDYAITLLTALGSTMAAVCALAIPFIRGPASWRVLAVVLASPALFVLSDFIRRAPYAFG